ncbi:MAG: hypothetical protein LR015_04695 [Verrucomicrobia bacterium]|nr:hypothetical protein [Verrucomicrobiota bacterium]
MARIDMQQIVWSHYLAGVLGNSGRLCHPWRHPTEGNFTLASRGLHSTCKGFAQRLSGSDPAGLTATHMDLIAKCASQVLDHIRVQIAHTAFQAVVLSSP